MRLKLYSIKNDLLELEIHPVRPNIIIAEIYFDGAWHPWHPQWQPLEIKGFHEDFDTVNNKLIEYYKAEKNSCTVEGGAVTRLPGRAELTTNEEEWKLNHCKIVDCQIDDEHKTIVLKLGYDEVCYKNLVERKG
jgi:hypothetical protein